MSDEAEDEHLADHLSAEFALMIGKLEDAATLAADGQGRHPDDAMLGYANQIAELANEAATIASAVAALLNSAKLEPTP